MKIVALIPARGGSKGVPRKNIRDLGGKPLIVHTIERAFASGCFTDIVVSTDDEELGSVARDAGAKVIMRPEHLANDTAPMLGVVQHTIATLPELGIAADAIALLQPTSPFRSVEMIRACVSKLQSGPYDSVITVQEVPPKYNPHWVYVEGEEGAIRLFSGADQPIARRQDLPPAFIREGSVYLFLVPTVLTYQNIYGRKVGYYVNRERVVNIDTQEDFTDAENYLKNLHNSSSIDEAIKPG